MSDYLPTEDERPILFRWLKQQSSYTIWRQIGPYFDDWITEFKNIPPEAVNGPESKLDFFGQDLRLMLTCRAAFIDAVGKLSVGDRTCFKWLGFGSGLGYFCEAIRTVDAWQASIARAMSGEELPLMDSPYWSSFDQKLKAVIHALSNGSLALQERNTDVPAPLQNMIYLRGSYPVLPGEDRPSPNPSYEVVRLRAAYLPSIPAPSEDVIIKTGDSVPCYGIWEPVKIDLTPGFVGLFKKPLIPADGKFELEGCMNYLHSGSPAPTIAFEEDDSRGEGRPTVWRLLWRDDRYGDRSIPAEEAEYIFVKPELLVDTKFSSETSGGLIVAASGAPAPQAGVRASKTELNVRVKVDLHTLLPQHEGVDIEWVHVPGV